MISPDEEHKSKLTSQSLLDIASWIAGGVMLIALVEMARCAHEVFR